MDCLVGVHTTQEVPAAVTTPRDPRIERLVRVCHVDNVVSGGGYLAGYYGHSFCIVAHKVGREGEVGERGRE